MKFKQSIAAAAAADWAVKRNIYIRQKAKAIKMCIYIQTDECPHDAAETAEI